jgi:hypothetical protein
LIKEELNRKEKQHWKGTANNGKREKGKIGNKKQRC